MKAKATKGKDFLEPAKETAEEREREREGMERKAIARREALLWTRERDP